MKKVIVVFALILTSLNFSFAKQKIAGLTIVTHGYINNGKLPTEWINFSQAIGKRAKNYKFYIYKIGNKTEAYNQKWKLYSENLEKNKPFEVIVLFDWSEYSKYPSSGYVVAGANALLAALLTPPDDLEPFLNTKKITSLLSFHKHFIGHSRGAILLAQLCHRIGFYFKDLKIEHFTSLDPHPAIFMGDHHLPSIFEGFDKKWTYWTAGTSHLRLAKNVLKADNYYRQDGNYEIGNFLKDKGAFDGLPVRGLGSFNRELNDELLTSKECFNYGGAHANIATAWYFGTIDTLAIKNGECSKIPAKPDWYARDFIFNETRSTTGFYYSRIGGGYDKLSKIQTDLQQDIIQPQIFYNGDFLYYTSALLKSVRYIAAWDGYKGDKSHGAIAKKKGNPYLLLDKGVRRQVHDLMYIPYVDGSNFNIKTLQLDVMVLKEDCQSKLLLEFVRANGEIIQLGEVDLCNKQSFKTYTFDIIKHKIPNSVGSFQFLLKSESAKIGIDNVKFGN